MKPEAEPNAGISYALALLFKTMGILSGPFFARNPAVTEKLPRNAKNGADTSRFKHVAFDSDKVSRKKVLP